MGVDVTYGIGGSLSINNEEHLFHYIHAMHPFERQG